MVKIKKTVAVVFVMLFVLTGLGFCANDIDPDPPHSIIKTVAP